MNQYFDKPIQIGMISALFNLNSRYFGRIFKEQEGIEFSNYVNQIRICKAKDMLRKKHVTISETALLCGYDDFAYFSRVFKKIAGCLPDNIEWASFNS